MSSSSGSGSDSDTGSSSSSSSSSEGSPPPSPARDQETAPAAAASSLPSASAQKRHASSRDESGETPSPKRTKSDGGDGNAVARKDKEESRPRPPSRSERARVPSRSRSRGRSKEMNGRAKLRERSQERERGRRTARSRSRSDSRDRRRRKDSDRTTERSKDKRENGGENKGREEAKNADRRKEKESCDADDRKSRKAPEESRKSDAPAPPKANVLLGQEVALTGRTGGVYIPPFKLAQMRAQLEKDKEKNTKELQRIRWEALRKSINGLINKVNVSNIANIIPELFQENLVRGRGLFVRAVMKAQMASPGFTHIYAALVAVVNTKLPEVGELLLKRVIFSFRRAYKRRDKIVATALVKFIGHLVNQQVAHEILALQIVEVLLSEPTDDSVEISVNFVKEVGQLLEEVSPRGLRAIFERFRGILHDGTIDKRVQYMIENLFAVRKSGFADYPAVPEALDLVEKGDKITFEIGLDDPINKEEMLDIFRLDPDYEENERLWKHIKKEILGESDSDGDADDEDGGDEDEEDEDEEGEEGQAQQASGDGQLTEVHDMTEQDVVNLKRTIYLTIMSSAGFEEATHKLMKLDVKEPQQIELCNMLVECCSQEKTYMKYYGLISMRFCLANRRFQDLFEQVFAEQYSTIHRLETNKLRNVAKLFAHLLYSDSMPWTVFEVIHLNEDETTSSSRIFIKILCQELAEQMGIKTLKERFSDPYMEQVFNGIFPRDNPRNTRFAINFFVSIGLGGLTDGLRQHLKLMSQRLVADAQAVAQAPASSSSSSSSSSDSDSSSSSSDSSSSSSSGSDSDSSSSSSSSSSDSDSD